VTQALRVSVDAARVRAAFASLRRKLVDLRGAWEQAGARVEERTAHLVPVESGALVDSLKAEAEGDGFKYGSDLVYAGVQDRGWPAHNIAGHHFMDAAAAEAGGAAVAELAPEIQNTIDRLGLR
jgi:hypothetical protein